MQAMRVIEAQALGLCFGVRDALEVARRLVEPTQVTIRGELVHNPLVTGELAARGFAASSEGADGVPGTARVMITAHGVSDRERGELLAAGKTLIDTTCPLVRKAHAAAVRLQGLGFHVLVIGQRSHVEVRGLTGDLRSFDVIETPNDVRRWEHAKLGIIAQTTCPERDALALVERVRRINPQALVRFVNTICQPTRDRQEAVERLLEQVDLLVVVGGRHSNNTRRLVQRSLQCGVAAVHVEHAGELHEALFSPGLTVGLTAGTSTLPETVAAVKARLEGMFVWHEEAGSQKPVARRNEENRTGMPSGAPAPQGMAPEAITLLHEE